MLASADDVRDCMPLFRRGRGGAIPTSALQLLVGVCQLNEACLLNSYWHSRLPHINPSNVTRNRHSKSYKAHYDDVVYAVAIWSSPVAANRLAGGTEMLELRRMAIADNAPKNTGSRMLRIMRLLITRDPYLAEIKTLISYQDTDVHTGCIYKGAGWSKTTTSPGVSWTTQKRERNREQTKSPKVRWELQLR